MSNPFSDQQPQQQGMMPQNSYQNSSTGGLIPYNNVPALVGYYLAVFSLIPIIGLPLGIAGVILGILGLVKKSKQPEVKGTAHALVGIILGGITTMLWSAGIILFMISVAHG